MDGIKLKGITDTSTKDKLQLGIMILIIIVLGLLAVNQYLGFRYKAELLQTPCQLCTQLNPNIIILPKDQLPLNSEPFNINPNVSEQIKLINP